MSRQEQVTIQIGGFLGADRTIMTRQVAEALMHQNPLARVVVIGDRETYHNAAPAMLEPGIGFEGTIKITDGPSTGTVEMHVQRWDMPETWEKKDDPIAQRSPFRLTNTLGQLKSLVDQVVSQDIFPLPKLPKIARLIFEEVEVSSLTAGKDSKRIMLPAEWFMKDGYVMEHANNHESYNCEGLARGAGSFTDALNINRPGYKVGDDDPQVIHFNSMFTLFVDMDLAVYSLEILDRALALGNGLTAPQYRLVEIELE